MATDVRPPWLMALKAYSEKKRQEESIKVMFTEGHISITAVTTTPSFLTLHLQPETRETSTPGCRRRGPASTPGCRRRGPASGFWGISNRKTLHLFLFPLTEGEGNLQLVALGGFDPIHVTK
ncbi:hypothetical protein EYF80_054389 [Liparis tanakae]|uniref:Uncharacterized protein n=1 Tax=Liparis tanakae TaxID=230148 RepID=A0A4Z2F4P0_9TELE|nr:hypothetical protein EYF80_054389 [Liparis tanakae]